MASEYANPGPLGLSGFGLTTILLNLSNCGAIGTDGEALGMVFAMGVLYGGIAQIIGGIFEFFKGNTFGMLAFISYGFFWNSLVFLNWFPKLGNFAALNSPVDAGSMSAYLFLWGLFSLGLGIFTLKKNRVLQAIFGTLVPLFWILALENLVSFHGYTDAANIIKKIAGIDGVFCGSFALYLAMAELNGWPVWPVVVQKSHEKSFKVKAIEDTKSTNQSQELNCV